MQKKLSVLTPEYALMAAKQVGVQCAQERGPVTFFRRTGA